MRYVGYEVRRNFDKMLARSFVCGTIIMITIEAREYSWRARKISVNCISGFF